MQFTAFSDLHGRPGQLPDGVGERQAGVAAIHQDRGHRRQAVLVPRDGVKRPLAVGDICGSDGYCMGQPLRVNHDMAFDAGHLFPRVVAFGAGAVRVFHALCINDAKARLGVASLIFLMPAPAG